MSLIDVAIVAALLAAILRLQRSRRVRRAAQLVPGDWRSARAKLGREGEAPRLWVTGRLEYTAGGEIRWKRDGYDTVYPLDVASAEPFELSSLRDRNQAFPLWRVVRLSNTDGSDVQLVGFRPGDEVALLTVMKRLNASGSAPPS